MTDLVEFMDISGNEFIFSWNTSNNRAFLKLGESMLFPFEMDNFRIYHRCGDDDVVFGITVSFDLYNFFDMEITSQSFDLLMEEAPLEPSIIVEKSRSRICKSSVCKSCDDVKALKFKEFKKRFF